MAPPKSGRVVAALLVSVLSLAIVAGPAFAQPAHFDEADFDGYATGNVLHADALDSGDLKVVDVEEAFTGAAVDSQGLTAIHNEMDRLVIPANASGRTFGRGSGLELGVAKGPDEPNDLALQMAAVTAPPDGSESADLLGPLSASPFAYASALRAEAVANWSDTDTCVLGRDLSSGLGYAADLQLLETGETNENGTFGNPLLAADAPDRERRVADSFSHEFLSVQQNEDGDPIGLPGVFGLSSEVRMTITPVTLFKGTPEQITLEIAGEWVLRASAGGIPGSAHITYGPGQTDASIPVLRIIQGLGEDAEVTDVVTLDAVLDAIGMGDGINLEIPGILEVTIGEQPRAIGGDFGSDPAVEANGTAAAAAVDVVRVTLLDGSATDLRIGHMETAARVPVDGIRCGIPVTKTAKPSGVSVGQAFTVTIKVDNPFGCDMTEVRLVDQITTQGDARFDIEDTNPPASSIVPDGDGLDQAQIVWNNIGPIPKGESRSVTVTLRARGGGGVIKDIAFAAAKLGNCTGEGDGSELVGNSPVLEVPVVETGKFLPETGLASGATAALGAMGLLTLASLGVRSLRRTKP